MSNQILKTYLIPSSQAMEKLGEALCQALMTPLNYNKVIYLNGDLGAGKTTLTRGILRFKQFKGAVKSPTYTLIEEYDFEDVSIYHFDLYRLESAYELENIGIRDYFHTNALCVIEWPEKGEEYCPSPDCVVTIHIQDSEKRVVQIKAVTQLGETILNNLEF